MDFQNILNRFEKEIIVKAVLSEDKAFTKICSVSTKDSKLIDFGLMIGLVIDTDLILTIDYYGYLKKAKGFIDKLNKSDEKLKTIDSFLVHFASIKMEDIISVTNDIDLIANFPKLKTEILIKRGFKKR